MLAAAVALGSLLGICATNALASATPPPSTPAAVAYQLNAGHTGVTADSVAASPTKRWSDVFPGGVSYPLIVGSRVYVTVAHASTYGTTLYALQAGTGAKLWSVNLGGTYYWSGLTYAAGRVFTVNYDGVMEASMRSPVRPIGRRSSLINMRSARLPPRPTGTSTPGAPGRAARHTPLTRPTAS